MGSFVITLHTPFTSGLPLMLRGSGNLPTPHDTDTAHLTDGKVMGKLICKVQNDKAIYTRDSKQTDYW